MKITKKTNLQKLIKKYPPAGEILASKYGLYCAGCLAAAFETLEQAGLATNTLKDKHNQFLSGIYNTLRGVNKQIGDFATDIFEKIEDGKHISKVMDENEENSKK